MLIEIVVNKNEDFVGWSVKDKKYIFHLLHSRTKLVYATFFNIAIAFFSTNFQKHFIA